MTGLYIHIPFCERKCFYCDFASYADKFDKVKSYIDAVIEESKDYEGAAVSTVFIGGGTPSCIYDGEIARLIDGIKKHIDLSDVCEFTIEANPNSLTYDKACEYYETGIDRISIGLQSSNERLLKLIGRLHSPMQFTDAVNFAKKAGIHNINADMMYSLPTQTVKDVRDTAEFILAHGVNHISAYSLILEEGTPLSLSDPVLPDEDTDREMFYTIKNVLKENGLKRYEISNFAAPGYESRHNLIYWRVNDYIGLGSAAHSCYNGMRYANPNDINEYILGIRHTGEEKQELLTEKIMLGTRLTEGIDINLLPDKKSINELIERMCKHGLCRTLNGRFMLTDAGMDIQNEILSELLNLL